VQKYHEIPDFSQLGCSFWHQRLALEHSIADTNGDHRVAIALGHLVHRNKQSRGKRTFEQVSSGDGEHMLAGMLSGAGQSCWNLDITLGECYQAILDPVFSVSDNTQPLGAPPCGKVAWLCHVLTAVEWLSVNFEGISISLIKRKDTKDPLSGQR
jgi:hypothetical protein